MALTMQIPNRCLFILIISILSLSNGCTTTTLPNVADVIKEAPASQETPHIASAKGVLSPENSQAIIQPLKRSVNPTDILHRPASVIESVCGSPLIKGNKVTLLVDGPATYAAMFKAIQNATDHINLESFIFEDIVVDDKTGLTFSDLLLAKQGEGVQVNLLYDSLGSSRTPTSLFNRLRDGGIRVTEFNPTNPFKARGKWRLARLDHRKILIVDGKVAFTGGINISSVYSGSLPRKEHEHEHAQTPWRDTDVQIEGPAVAVFQQLFLDSWRRQKGAKLPERNYFPEIKEDPGNTLVEVVASKPGEANRVTFIMYVASITFAEHSIHITNAYFVPDRQTVNALMDAAKRGVDVKIILPGTTDSLLAQFAGEYFYTELLNAGVKLYKRRDALLHAKTLVIDDVWSTIGTTNMDFWSFSTNDEVNAVILSREFATEMEELFSKDLALSSEIQLEQWKKRSLFSKARERFAHLFARWL